MKSILITGMFVAAILCAPIARSQQSQPDQNGGTATTPDQPLPPMNTSTGSGNGGAAAPAGRSILGYGSPDASDDSSQTSNPPLSGAESVGSALVAPPRNFFDLSALLSGGADSGVINTAGMTIWGGDEVLGGQLSYNRAWAANQFSVSYLGGGELYQPTALFPSAMFHSLSLSQQFSWKRVKLTVIDQFSYSPNSLFGGVGIGGPGLLGETGQVSTPSLSSTYSTGTSILTGQTRLLSNAGVVEMQYNFSPRSSFTVTGDYGLLDYLSGGYISSHEIVAGAGYNHSFTAKDTLAVTYNFSRAEYTGTPEDLDFQQFNLAYAHEITNRLVFQIAGGPEFISFQNYTPSMANALTWSLTAGAQYRWRRASVGVTYSHGTNVGSGVYSGAISQTVGANASRNFSRFLIGAFFLGYSSNASLTTSMTTENQFRNFYGSASLGRQIGRFMHLSANYGITQQPYGGTCPVTSCGTNHAVQTFGVSLDLHLKPIGTIE
jgi:hypothetical protein